MTANTSTIGPEAADSTTSRAGWVLALACTGVFLTSLDVVVVATALPTLQADLGASLSDLEWTINAYNLTFACMMLTGAALGDRFGRRRMFVLGVLVFTGSSAACALSSTTGQLIGARVLQGAGAAIVLPLTLTLISEAFPLAKRGAAIGIWGGVSGLGVAAGPVLGGAIVEGWSWQWIFWLNVPVGLVLVAASLLRLPESRGPRPHLDIRGLVLVALGLVALTWGPVRAPSAGWDSLEVIATLTLGVLLVALFLIWERSAPHAMLPLRYFRSRGFAIANAVAFFQFASLIGSLFMITQLFQIGLGYSPLQAGVRILVWMAMPMLVAPLAGALSDKVGNKPFIVGGLLCQGAGLGWLSAVIEPGASYRSLVIPLIIAGIGIAMCFPTVANEVVGSVPLEDSGVAAGTNSALRELGGVFGVAIVGAVFAANGSYLTPESFIAGFQPTIYVAAAIPAFGLLATLLLPSKPQSSQPRIYRPRSRARAD